MNYLYKNMNHLYKNKIFIVLILLIIVSLILYFIFKRMENFDNLSLPEDRLLMITDKNGNIDTLPISSINSYLRSIESDINNTKENISTRLTDLSKINQNIDTLKNNSLQKGLPYKVKIGANFNTSTLFS